MEKKLKELEKKVRIETQRLTSYSAKVLELGKEIARLEKVIKTLELRRDSVTQKIKDREADYEDVGRQQAAKLAEDIRKLRKEGEDAQKKIDETTRATIALGLKLQDVKAKEKQLSIESKMVEQRSNDLEKKKGDIKEREDRLSERIKGVKEDELRVKTRLTQLNDKVKRVTQKEVSLDIAINRSRKEEVKAINARLRFEDTEKQQHEIDNSLKNRKRLIEEQEGQIRVKTKTLAQRLADVSQKEILVENKLKSFERREKEILYQTLKINQLIKEKRLENDIKKLQE